ncbi:NADH-quinone oxidoreductase subunit N [Candidatus Methylacidithermus pantelleriae]|uniref:NADH-quinone oxidoreductase subunit N n=1 Tax=Candidatus Methylacidithermus pantelleriae TaxID=2744239 RepID=A0A8J2BJR0_9BACT|nr:NADH-quinone oxidoreductase subunit N [Candidatus Methylacidithermus pantelleriae]CAF0700772.1 NADH-quinone oxidoreductase subunit N [Candidatus Methylacidithermus pantelleriae]
MSFETFVMLLSPEALLVGVALGLLSLQSFFPLPSRRVGELVLLATGLVSLAILFTRGYHGIFWHGAYVWDPMASFWKGFFVVSTFLLTFLSLLGEPPAEERAEFFILPLFSAAGMCLLASARDFLVLFVALELVTLSLYVLVGYQRGDAAALEAAVKYLIVGALASAFVVMGIAYIYGATGSTQFDEVAARAARIRDEKLLLLVAGVLLLLVGLGFKTTTVPFHAWAPDVYQGAPTPVTAFLAVASKASGFVALLRVLNLPLAAGVLRDRWIPALVLCAALSVLLGNLAAIPQRNVKRMLAYSGIGHAGFLLIGLSSGNPVGCASVLYYLWAYLLAIFSAFLVLVLVGREGGGDNLSDLAGLYRRSPLLAWSMALAMVSLAGIPPLSGFFGKLMVFLAAWQSGHYLLVAVGLACAAAGLYYYLGVIRVMFWSEPSHPQTVLVPWPAQVVLYVLLGALVFLGLYAQPLLEAVARIVS